MAGDPSVEVAVAPGLPPVLVERATPRASSRMVARAVVLLLAAFPLTFTAPPLPVSAAGLDVLLSTPRYDSPGALVPVIVTAVDVPDGYATTLAVSSTRVP